MNPLDWALIVVLLLFILGGVRRGFIWQVCAMIGVVAAFLLAGKFHGDLASTGIFESIAARSARAALVTSFLSIFIVATLVFSWFATKVGKKLEEKGLKRFDKTLGGVLGGAKGVLILGGVALGIQEVGLPKGAVLSDVMVEKGEGWIAGSALLPRLSAGCVILIDMIPAETRDAVVKKVRENKDLFELGDDRPAGASEKSPNPAPPPTAGQLSDPTSQKTGGAPVDSALVDSALVDSAPVDSAPVDSALVDSAPVDSALVDSAPVDSAPVETGAARPTPVPALPAEGSTPRARDSLSPLLREGLDLGALRRLTFEENDAAIKPAASKTTD